jgi:fermentation-respiration switch protein FrsA (DUF1100 family)
MFLPPRSIAQPGGSGIRGRGGHCLKPLSRKLGGDTLPSLLNLGRMAARVGSDPTASLGEKVGIRMAETLTHTSWARAFMESTFYWRTGARLPSQFEDVTPAVVQMGSRPILFIVGEQDHVAPPEDSERMYDAAQSPLKAIVIVPGANHNSTFDANPALYEAKVLTFLNAAVSR